MPLAYSRYTLTRQDAIQRLDAARALLASQLDPLHAAADHLDQQAEAALEDARELREHAQQLHDEAVRLELAAANALAIAGHLTNDPTTVERAHASAAQMAHEAKLLDDTAAQQHTHADQLTNQAHEQAARATGARALAGDVEFNLGAIARRLTAARTSDEGAARALDEAAHLVLNLADWLDGAELLPATTSLDQARALAREARS